MIRPHDQETTTFGDVEDIPSEEHRRGADLAEGIWRQRAVARGCCCDHASTS
jgi:hypothetical protein